MAVHLRMAVLLAAVGAVLASGVNNARIPSVNESSRALRRMLTYADVPRYPAELQLVDPGWEWTIKADSTLRISLCSIAGSGRNVQSRPVSLLYQVELGELNNVSDPISVEQKVYSFNNASLAIAVWDELLQRASACRGWHRDPAAPGAAQELTHGRTPQKVNGEQGLWVLERWKKVNRTAGGAASGDAPLNDSGDSEVGSSSMFILFRVRNTIFSLEYDYAERSMTLPTEVRTSLTHLVQRLAHRWQGNWSWRPQDDGEREHAAVIVQPRNNMRVPTVAEAADRQKRLITYADVPADLPVDGGWEYTIKSDAAIRIQLCDTPDGRSVLGSRPLMQFNVELGETDLIDDAAGIENKPYLFTSAAEARAEFNTILRRATAGCNGRFPDASTPGRTLVYATGRTQLSYRGLRGFWVHETFEDRRVASDAGKGDAAYFVYFLANNTIYHVQYDYPWRLNPLSASRMHSVDRLAVTLADRWLAK